MRTRFIFNPHSGHNRRRPGRAQAIRDFLVRHRLDADLVVTGGPGHATELARAAVAAGCGIVAAVGGDGTMNEVAQAVVGTPAALALVPCGSGNGLALHLGLPHDGEAALRLATGADARIVAMDTGRANGRPFFNAMGVGLDADVSRRFNRLVRRGLLAYARVALAAIRHPPSERCTVVCDGRAETLDALLVTVANSDQYGNHARIAPGARVDDGLLDLVAIRAVGRLRAATLVPRLFLGTMDRSPHVWRRRGVRFEIRRSHAGHLHTDGESHAAEASIAIEVRPRSLRMVVPARCPAVRPPPGERQPASALA